MSNPPSPPRSLGPYSASFIITSCMVVVAILLVRAGMTPRVAYDEAWHIFLATVSPAWKAFQAAASDLHPVPFYVLLRPFARLGQEPVWPRLLSIIPTVLTIPLLYSLLRKIQINRTVALTATVVLASSFYFQSLGVTVRSYAFATFLLLAALWFWLDMLPGGGRKASRLSAIMSLMLFSAAFSALYVALLFTTTIFLATLMVMAVDPSFRRQTLANWRRFSGCPLWLTFFAIHALNLAWYYVGVVSHGVAPGMPSHVTLFGPQPGQALVDFLVTGLQRELALFTPLAGLGETVLNGGLIAILGLIVWLVVHNLRKGHPSRALLALSPLILTAILATLALMHKYPFGGEMRHQYILFPLLLLLLPLGMDSIWKRLPNTAAKGILAAVVIVIAIVHSVQMHNTRGLSEAPAEVASADGFKLLFETADDIPIFIPAYSFFPSYMDRYRHQIWYHYSYQVAGGLAPNTFAHDYQGWASIALPWPSYEMYGYKADDGSEGRFIKDSYRWLFDPIPDALFFSQLRGMLKVLKTDRAQIFAPQPNPSIVQNEEGLRAAARDNGFAVTEFTPLSAGVIWSVEMGRKPISAGIIDP